MVWYFLAAPTVCEERFACNFSTVNSFCKKYARVTSHQRWDWWREKLVFAQIFCDALFHFYLFSFFIFWNFFFLLFFSFSLPISPFHPQICGSCTSFLEWPVPSRLIQSNAAGKGTVTAQLVKLLIYSVFNQINERVGTFFNVPTQLFMVYGNWPKLRVLRVVATLCPAILSSQKFRFYALWSRNLDTYFLTYFILLVKK